jgi:hypothetical protein
MPDADGMIRSAIITTGDDVPADVVDPYGGPPWHVQRETLRAPLPRRLRGLFGEAEEGDVVTPSVAALRSRVEAGHVRADERLCAEIVGIGYGKYRATISDADRWRTPWLTAGHLVPSTAAGGHAGGVVEDAAALAEVLEMTGWKAKDMPPARIETARARADRIVSETWHGMGDRLAWALARTGERGAWREEVLAAGVRAAREVLDGWEVLDQRVAYRTCDTMVGALRKRLA